MLLRAMENLGSRAVALVLGGWLAASGCAGRPGPAAPPLPAPPTDARDYYPLEPGWKWAYDVERGAERILAVYAVKAREGTVASIESGVETLRYEVSEAGIARLGSPTEMHKRGVMDYLLKNPIAPGASWLIDGGVARVTGIGVDATVPAGRFPNCLVVEEARESPTRLVRTTYAPGVGPIVIESLVHVPGAGKFQTTLRASLRGVTRPGEDPTR